MNWLIRPIPADAPSESERSWEVGYYAPVMRNYYWVVYQSFAPAYRDQAEQLVHYLNGGEIPV